MLQYTLRRFGQMVIVLFVVSVLIFTVTRFTGDPVMLIVSQDASDTQIAAARAELGLDRPLYQQYGVFAQNALHGNLGTSFVFRRSATELIVERMPATLEMTIFAMLLSAILAIPLGVFAGAYPRNILSKSIMSSSLVGISLPSFWLGIMLILIFSVLFRPMCYHLPDGGRQ